MEETSGQNRKCNANKMTGKCNPTKFWDLMVYKGPPMRWQSRKIQSSHELNQQLGIRHVHIFLRDCS